MNNQQEIVEGCINNNRKAQEELYRFHAGKMFSICRTYTLDIDSTKEVMQQGFVKVFKNIHQFQHDGEIGAWIRKIMINTCLDYCRKVDRERCYDIDNISEIHISKEKSNQNLHFSDLIDIIGTLPTKARIIFNLFAVEGYSHKEIAIKLNISESTSKTQYMRARQLLQERIPDSIKYIA